MTRSACRSAPTVWGDTLIELPREPRGPTAFRSVLDGRELAPQAQGDGSGFLAGEVLAEFPVAVLSRLRG